MISESLKELEGVDVIIYEPNAEVKEILQKEDAVKDIKLTPGRAMVLYALFKYERYGEMATVFVANRLAYFLQESGENLKLKFEQYSYGPYAQAMDKVLYALNGKYLRGMEQMNAKPFEPLYLNYERYQEVEAFVNHELTFEQRQRLDDLFKTIDGFESTLSLEILSSTHFILKGNRSLSPTELIEKVQWNARKKDLITPEHINIAYEHLQEYGNLLQIA